MKSERLIRLVLALQRNAAISAPELANRLGVSVRTIFRDLDALSTLGIPVYTLAGRGGGIRLPAGYKTDLTVMSSYEAEALALIGAPAGADPRTLGQSLDSALAKMSAALPSMHQARAQRARERLLFDTRPWFRSVQAPPLLEQLRAATWEDRWIQVQYPTRDGRLQPLRLAPHALVVKVDAWYLVARQQQQMRVFKVSRLSDLQVEAQTFTRQPDFVLGTFWSRWRDDFERQPPNRYLVQLQITPRGRALLLQSHGSWLGSVLEPLGTDFERRTLTLDLQREEIAASVLSDVAAEIRIQSPERLRLRLRNTATALLAATRGAKVRRR